MDIEGTDFSLDGLVKFLRQCQILKNTPAETSKINNQLFKDFAFKFETLKEHLKLNENYIKHITQNLNNINLNKLNKNALIDALKKDSDEEGNFIDAEASINLFFDQLKSVSLSKLFLNAQLNRLDTLIAIFTNIGEMTKWNALQRGIVVLYPKILEEQAQILNHNNVINMKHSILNTYWRQEIILQQNKSQIGLLEPYIQQSLPNGLLSPLRVLMVVLKQADETPQV